jgi:hypothetical protein
MAKTKRFMVGGMATPNTYPFANPNTVAPDTSVKIGGRQEPLDEVMGTQEPVTMYKRGGKVKKYADGGIYTSKMGQPPMDPEVAKPSKKKPDPDADIFTAEKLKGKKEAPRDLMPEDFKKKSKPMAKGGCAKFAKGGMIDGCAQRGKTKGRMR